MDQDDEGRPCNSFARARPSRFALIYRRGHLRILDALLRARQHAQATAAASSTARNCTVSSLPLGSREGSTKDHRGPSPTQSSSSKRASLDFRVVAALVNGSSKMSSEPLPTNARQAPRTVVLEVDALQALPSGSALLHVPSSVAARAAADADANHARPRWSVAAAENADFEWVGAKADLSNMALSDASKWNSGARNVTTCTSTLSIACTSPSLAAAAAQAQAVDGAEQRRAAAAAGSSAAGIMSPLRGAPLPWRTQCSST